MDLHTGYARGFRASDGDVDRLVAVPQHSPCQSCRLVRESRTLADGEQRSGLVAKLDVCVVANRVDAPQAGQQLAAIHEPPDRGRADPGRSELAAGHTSPLLAGDRRDPVRDATRNGDPRARTQHLNAACPASPTWWGCWSAGRIQAVRVLWKTHNQ
jgi:hypothetical protein